MIGCAPSHRAHAQVCALALCAVAVLWQLTGGVQRAEAFSDPDEFAVAAAAGGGGGRYFTGSFLDGYGCNVCHRGGPEPQLSVIGLPIEGYQPGQTYEVEVTWPNVPMRAYALQLELLGRNGGVPGQVLLPDPATIDVRGRCGGLPNGEVPAYERTVGARKVIGVEACMGTQSLRFRFIPADVPDLAFSASIITSDMGASVEGDGVRNMQRVLYRVGAQPSSGGCGLVSGRARLPVWPLSLSLALIALWRRKRAP